MLFFKKTYLIFNPLEQFEINTSYYYFSNFFSNIIKLTTDINTNVFFIKQNSINTTLINNSDNFIFFFDLQNKLFIKNQYYSTFTYYNYNHDYLFSNQFDNYSTFLNWFSISDFFFINILISICFFFILYQNYFFFHFIKNSIKFCLFFIINFLLNIIKNMNFNLIKYSPYLISLFIFILILNILGLIPFVKSLTSTISITFFLSFSSFLGLNIEGLLVQNWYFFDKFAPASVPFMILPGLVLIELISYFMRPNSLAIRLFANMLAGHILIKLFITFCLDLSGISLFLFVGCFFFICILMTLEVFISFLQAFIFMLLVLLYLDDVLNAQH